MGRRRQWLRIAAPLGLGCLLVGAVLFWVRGREEPELASLEEVVTKNMTRMLRASDYIGAAGMRKPRVSALPFTDFSDAKTGLAGLTSGLVVEQLTRSGKVRLFDQSTIDAVTKEQQLARDGLADPSTMLRTGKIRQPEVLVVGRVGIIDGQGRLMLTLVDPVTSEVTWKESFSFESTAGLRRLDSTKSSVADARISEESFWSLFKEFFVTNWPWMWTVVLVPAVAWLLRRLSMRRSKEESTAASPQETTPNPAAPADRKASLSGR